MQIPILPLLNLPDPLFNLKLISGFKLSNLTQAKSYLVIEISNHSKQTHSQSHKLISKIDRVEQVIPLWLIIIFTKVPHWLQDLSYSYTSDGNVQEDVICGIFITSWKEKETSKDRPKFEMLPITSDTASDIKH